jgi:hypothetical protein
MNANVAALPVAGVEVSLANSTKVPFPGRVTSPGSDVRPGANGTDMAANTASPECKTGSDRDKQAPHSYLLSI